jgi:hypothetical protein
MSKGIPSTSPTRFGSFTFSPPPTRATYFLLNPKTKQEEDEGCEAMYQRELTAAAAAATKSESEVERLMVLRIYKL